MGQVTSSDSEMYRLRRQLWFQSELLAALADDQPVQALMVRLGQFVRGTAALYDEAGHVAASVGEGPIRLIAHELVHRDRDVHRFGVGRYHVLAGPVVMRGSGYWVALASRYPSTIDEIGEPLLESTQRMLSAMRGARSLSRTQEQTRARHLLTLLALEVTSDRVPALWRRLRGLRFSPNQPMRAVVAARTGIGRDSPRARADRLEALHESAHLTGLPLVLADEPTDSPRDEPLLVALAPDEEMALARWCARVATQHVVGVSEPFTDLLHAPAAFRDARMAVRVGATSRRQDDADGPVVWFEDVDLATWLLSSRPVDDVNVRVTRQFGELLQRDELRDTLVVHLALGLDIAATAQRLFLHPNSVRYRLRRVEELIGASLQSPATLANLYLAFHEAIGAVPEEADPGAAD
ncbi:PucR family transcriptional regulator [Mobilicoccus massiliensis]|uniref:PucR family transcriptional regulator n=1 Tax=Mobilicoccus massiliensis TaxID=1522310 RepID=UPI000693CF10|nr:helix-turn-helix domain-containing protein [Mobilicoccus massiliensis]